MSFNSGKAKLIMAEELIEALHQLARKARDDLDLTSAWAFEICVRTVEEMAGVWIFEKVGE